jgi:hypothetical protein
VSPRREPPVDEPRDDEEGLSEEELAREEGSELPARQAMSAIGDISVPLDPASAADALLGHDDAGDDAD